MNNCFSEILNHDLQFTCKPAIIIENILKEEKRTFNSQNSNYSI